MSNPSQPVIRQVGGVQVFETTNLHLAAVLLALIPGAQLTAVENSDQDRSLKVIRLGYPDDQDERIRLLMVAFADRRLSVNLALYNRYLNLIRDRLGLRRRSESMNGGLGNPP